MKFLFCIYFKDNIDELNDDAIFDVLFFEPQESETVKSIENFDTVNNNISTSNRRIAPSTSIEELDTINTGNGQNVFLSDMTIMQMVF
jgi:hypothetical protein